MAKLPLRRSGRATGSAAKAPGERPTTSRATPAGDEASSKTTAAKAASSKRATPKATARYTPPVPRSQKVSPLWVPILMFTCLGLGMVIILINYVDLLPGDGPSNVYLLIGLGLITAGFITATRYH